MNKELKVIFASIGIVFLILNAWYFTYHIGCFSLLIPILIMLILASSYIEVKLKQKECFRNCYFKESTLISKLIMSPYLTSIFYILLSTSYTVTLICNILFFDMKFYLLISIFIFISFKIYLFISNLFSGIVNDKQLEIFSREITSKITAFLLFSIYMFIFINSYEPDYLKETLQETLNVATKSISSNCMYIDTILRIKIEIDAQLWFYMTTLDNELANKNFKIIYWVSFIIFNTMSILGLNRLIIQIIYIANKNFKDKNGN